MFPRLTLVLLSLFAVRLFVMTNKVILDTVRFLRSYFYMQLLDSKIIKNHISLQSQNEKQTHLLAYCGRILV